MAVVWAALMPHPPVILPEIGKGRELEAGRTLQGLAELRERITSRGAIPESIVVLSPHQPYVQKVLFVNSAPAPQGSFARFGAPGLRMHLKTDLPLIKTFADHLKKLGVPAGFGEAPDLTTDHGAMVPLRIIADCFPLPPVILANPSGLSPELALRLGQALALLGREKDIALLASGDLSHKLKDDGPYGFHPAGPVLDDAITQALAQGDPSLILNLAPSVRDNAAECGLRPALALLGLCQAPLEVLSYEGPFGVGYCTAFFSPAA